MNKELIDKAWACLPREFREEVKKDYQYALTKCETSNLQRGVVDTLEDLFGEDNLTSDAEGEDEMLYVSRKKVQEKCQRAYKNESEYAKAEQNSTIYAELYYNRGILSILDTLFGSAVPAG